MDSLQGQRVLVTGGGSGIGLQTAIRFRECGAEVLVSDLSQTALREAELLGLGTVKADAASADGVRATVAAVGAQLGGLDTLVNNAGVAGPTAGITEVDFVEWQNTMRINVDSQFLHIQQLADLLRSSECPSIVNVSSAAGLRAFRDRSPYASSKWAVIGLTKSAAAELGPWGIRVNAVCPGMIEGPRLERVIEAKAKALSTTKREARSLFLAQAAMGIASSPTDVANAIVFLSSSMARTISGQVLSVDGFIERMA